MTDPAPSPDAPPFDEPWQAQLFALTLHLSQRGAFAWGEWAQALGGEIAMRRAGSGAQDGGPGYWSAWLAALERLLQARGIAGGAEVQAMRDAWAAAHLATPHGAPVRLG